MIVEILLRGSRMKRFSINNLLILMLLLAPMFVFGQYERPGASSAQFLKIGVSPKATGMGDSYIAVAQGPEAVFYNPAAITRIDGIGVTATHNEWFAGVNHDFVAIAGDFGNLGSFGLSMTNFSTDVMKVRTPLQPEGTGETFYVSEYLIGFTYARRLTNHVSFGGNIKYMNISLYKDFTQSAFATDISVLYATEFRGFCFGMKVANFGSSLNFVNEEYPLPQSFSFGMKINAIESENQILLASLTAEKPNDVRTLIRGGFEWNFTNMIFLRTGYNFNHDTATFSVGGGLKLNISNNNIGIDYSYTNYSELGGVNKIGIDFIL